MTEIIDGTPQPVNVGDHYVKATWFATIASGTTSGTITKPAGGGADVSFVMDEWGVDTDALVSTMVGGKPTFESPVTAGGVVITTTFNTAGEFAFSGTPSPVGSHAVVFVYKCYLKNFNVSESLFESEPMDVITPGDVDDTPVDGAATTPISSNWAFDHNAKGAHPSGIATGDVIRYNVTSGAWEVKSEPLSFSQIILTPAVAAILDAEGGMWYNSTDKSMYICTEAT